jgi:hypothetical protein
LQSEHGRSAQAVKLEAALTTDAVDFSMAAAFKK